MTTMKTGLIFAAVAGLVPVVLTSCAPVVEPVADFEVVEATIPAMQRAMESPKVDDGTRIVFIILETFFLSKHVFCKF